MTSSSVLQRVPDECLRSIVHYALCPDASLAAVSKHVLEILKTLNVDCIVFEPLLLREFAGIRAAVLSQRVTWRFFDRIVAGLAKDGSAQSLLAGCRAATRRWRQLQMNKRPLWADVPFGIVLRDAVWHLLVSDAVNDYQYDTFHTVLDDFAAFTGAEARGVWRIDFLETLCDSVVFPRTQASATFLLGAVRVIDSLNAYRTLLGPLSRYLRVDQLLQLTAEAEITFDWQRAGPYH